MWRLSNRAYVEVCVPSGDISDGKFVDASAYVAIIVRKWLESLCASALMFENSILCRSFPVPAKGSHEAVGKRAE
jgi:hypothetical protein